MMEEEDDEEDTRQQESVYLVSHYTKAGRRNVTRVQQTESQRHGQDQHLDNADMA